MSYFLATYESGFDEAGGDILILVFVSESLLFFRNSLTCGSSVLVMVISNFPTVAMNFGYLATIGDNMNCLTIVTESTCLPQNIATRTRQYQTKSPNNRFRKAEATPTNQSQSFQSHQHQCYRRVKQFLIQLMSDRCCQTQSNCVVQFVATVI
jgi:hypothetical protein